MSRIARGSLIAFVALIFGAPQARAAENGRAGWIGLHVRVPFAERYAFEMLTEPRLFENAGQQLRLVLLRPWFSASLPRGFGVGLGYDALVFWKPVSRQEHRLWQEVLQRHDFGRARTLARFRLEQRFFSGRNRASIRGRFLLGVAVELGLEFELLLNNEFLLNFNEVSIVGRQGYTENRLYGGVARRFTPWIRAALGYQMQWVDAGAVDLINHTAMLLVSFDIVRKQD